MRLPTPSAASVRSGAMAAVKWIGGGGLAVGLILAVATCSIERQNASKATVQTYNIGRIAAFRDSGAELDKRVAAFNDVAAEGQSLTETRQAVRSALADHASKTMAMKDVFGEGATAIYTADLKRLQREIEATDGPSHAGPIITAMSRAIVTRNELADAATKKATS